MIELSFGTSGIRAISSTNKNNMNEKTIEVLAHATSVFQKQGKVIVGYDTRQFSKIYAQIFCEVLCKNNIKTKMFPTYSPTPLLVFCVTNCNFDLGIMITASHNPAQYNGIKFYNKNGTLLCDKNGEKISDIYAKLAKLVKDEPEIIKSKTNKQNAKNFYFANFKKIKNEFLSLAKSCKIKKYDNKLLIAYTPLNGTGYDYVKNVLQDDGNTVFIPQIQSNPDYTFASCPSPNPENEQSWEKVLQIAQLNNCELVLATDPDADRLGSKVLHCGKYINLSGNDIGILFLDYILKYKILSNPFCVTTVVSTPLAKLICQKYKCNYFETLTGFKNISSVISSTKGDLALAFEESIGFIVDKRIFDKDGVSSALLLTEITQFYKQKQMTIIDALNNLKMEFGFIETANGFLDNVNCTKIVQKLIDYAKNNNILFVDYNKSDQTHLPPSNFVKLIFKENSYIIIRPSGTEPKLKFYSFSGGKSSELAKLNAQKQIENLKEIIFLK
ncbi:MAG: hypothetical protein RR140_02605 [Clostridia bacterium]